MGAAMDVASGIAALKGLASGIESVNQLLTAMKDTKHHEQLVQLKEALLNAKEETLSLREEVINLRSQLSASLAKAKQEQSMESDGTFYWTGKERSIPTDGPYCTRCFDVDKRAVRLKNIRSDYFSCPECKTSHEGPNSKAESRTSVRTTSPFSRRR